MKFSQVVVLFGALFALSYAIPYKMDMVVEDSADELATSNDPEKRFVTLALAKLATIALDKAVTAYCAQSGLSSTVQRGCQCTSAILGVVGDEEMKAEKNFRAEKKWWVFDNLLEKLKSAVNKGCSAKYVNLVDTLKQLCGCIQGTIV